MGPCECREGVSNPPYGKGVREGFLEEKSRLCLEGQVGVHQAKKERGWEMVFWALGPVCANHRDREQQHTTKELELAWGVRDTGVWPGRGRRKK